MDPGSDSYKSDADGPSFFPEGVNCRIRDDGRILHRLHYGAEFCECGYIKYSHGQYLTPSIWEDQE